MQRDAAEALVRNFFARWGKGYDEMRSSFVDTLGAECVWRQTALPEFVGGEAAARFMDDARTRFGLERIDVHLSKVVVDVPHVVTERLDVLLRADGSEIVRFEVVGIMTVNAQQITSWREYFDSADLARLPASA